jgi:GNAT superfamily N-acetyltransferase
MPSVEPFSPSDQAEVVELVLSIQQHELGVPVTLLDQPDLADVQGFYGRGAGGFWVARSAGALVGTIGLLDAGQGEGVLRKMFVHVNARGKTHGVAAALLLALVDHARARGFHHLTLGTRPELYAAHRFYEKNAFIRLAETALFPGFPRMAVDSVFYRRAIG